ncbi:hypothetical protein [Gryllotalpicola sp.]|uniref:hypothetical protein n=1 Tax=Gryllotalpicola sp. TaxID=1932787 RepID=UPI00262AE81D|nr:hypothetical protein [Gryllotalpicola sp.]
MPATVNWLPHPSPDGAHLVYASFPPGIDGHPEDIHDGRLRLTKPADGTGRELVTGFGGQEAMTVGGWAPDSRRLTYFEYNGADH